MEGNKIKAHSAKKEINIIKYIARRNTNIGRKIRYNNYPLAKIG
jgi:hypothetical protein